MWYYSERKPLIAEQRERAQREIDSRRDRGLILKPIRVEGRKITKNFWGKAWCEHLKQHCDLHNRLDKGRSYVSNGFVIDFELHEGTVHAQVIGSRVYQIEIDIKKLEPDHWQYIKERTAGQMGSLVELLQGKLSDAVMSVIIDPLDGLFPQHQEMTFRCTCPDAGGRSWMCKHVAATLYAVGAKVDESPDLFFKLRGVDHLDLIESAAANVGATTTDGTPTIADEDLSAIFGIDLGEPVVEPIAPVSSSQKIKKSPKTAKAVRSKKSK